MQLKPLSLLDVEQVRQWRKEQLSILRTSFPLTEEMQSEFYHEVVCDRQTNARYWGAWEKGFPTKIALNEYATPLELIGMAGIEGIQWENRLGEISLIMNPVEQRLADEALQLLLCEAFLNLNLENVFTEVYACSPYQKFWAEQAHKYGGYSSVLPYRKYWQGNYCDSEYINFNKGAYLEHESTILKPAYPLN